MTIQEEVEKLPKPKTLEEQYLYALVCSVAGVPYEEPFNNPFWRMEQYWQAFFKATSKRILDPLTIDDTSIIKDGVIKQEALTSDVTDKLLGDGKVTESMLSSAVESRLLAENRVLLSMLAAEVSNRLLGNDRVEESMLVSAVRDKLDKTALEESIAALDERLKAVEAKVK